MKDVWAITCRIMSRLLARLRRRMAVTAAFQSNQNDRVTLERRGEDIFLASRSHRDALFSSPPSSRYLFIYLSIYLIWFLLRRRSHGCLVSIGMPVCGAELTRRRGLSAEGADVCVCVWGGGVDCFTSLALLTSLFVPAVSIKCCSLPAGCWEERLTQPLKITSPRCL